MEKLIELSQTEIKLAFVASCIEGTAGALGKSYHEIFERMKRVGMIRNYIWSNYEMLHTESRENVTKNMIECLTNWEADNEDQSISWNRIGRMILLNLLKFRR